MRSTPAETARSTTASTSFANRGSSRCACASITRAGSGGVARQTREQRCAGLDLTTRLERTPHADVRPARALGRRNAELLGDARAHVRRVRIQQVAHEAQRLEAGIERSV